MKFLLAICAPPSSETALQAYRFAEALLQQDHQISQLFFYAQGVLNSRRHNNALGENWHTLINLYQLDAVCCANSAGDHELLEASQRLAGFSIAGIAQLSTEAINCDRCITFGTRLTIG